MLHPGRVGQRKALAGQGALEGGPPVQERDSVDGRMLQAPCSPLLEVPQELGVFSKAQPDPPDGMGRAACGPMGLAEDGDGD